MNRTSRTGIALSSKYFILSHEEKGIALSEPCESKGWLIAYSLQLYANSDSRSSGATTTNYGCRIARSRVTAFGRSQSGDTRATEVPGSSAQYAISTRYRP